MEGSDVEERRLNRFVEGLSFQRIPDATSEMVAPVELLGRPEPLGPQRRGLEDEIHSSSLTWKQNESDRTSERIGCTLRDSTARRR